MPRPDWLIWVSIGPLIAVLLALRLRPAYLTVLGLTAFVGCFATFKTNEKLYPDCLDAGCPPWENRLSVLSGILFLLGAALLLLSLTKFVFRTRSNFSAKPSSVMSLGRLPELIDRLAGIGSGIAITPVLKEGIAIGGLETPGKTLHVTGWTITYETAQGSFTVNGKTIPEAVDAAFANPDAW